MSDGQHDSQHLKALNDLLPQLTGIVRSQTPSAVEYETESGTCLGIPLYTSPNGSVAVQRCLMSASARITTHQHDVHETLVLYDGEATVTMNGTTSDMVRGVPVYIPPGTGHNVEARTDCWMIGVTQPRSNGYP